MTYLGLHTLIYTPYCCNKLSMFPHLLYIQWIISYLVPLHDHNMDWFVHTDSPTDNEILFTKSDVHVMMLSPLENMIGLIMHMSVFIQLYVKYPPSIQDIALDGMEWDVLI